MARLFCFTLHLRPHFRQGIQSAPCDGMSYTLGVRIPSHATHAKLSRDPCRGSLADGDWLFLSPLCLASPSNELKGGVKGHVDLFTPLWWLGHMYTGGGCYPSSSIRSPWLAGHRCEEHRSPPWMTFSLLCQAVCQCTHLPEIPSSILEYSNHEGTHSWINFQWCVNASQKDHVCSCFSWHMLSPSFEKSGLNRKN